MKPTQPKCPACQDKGTIYTIRQVTEQCECVESLDSHNVLACVTATGIAYCDRSREVSGDYACVARLPFSTLTLEWTQGQRRFVSSAMQAAIELDAGKIAARRGEAFQVSTAGQTITLGRK